MMTILSSLCKMSECFFCDTKTLCFGIRMILWWEGVLVRDVSVPWEMATRNFLKMVWWFFYLKIIEFWSWPKTLHHFDELDMSLAKSSWWSHLGHSPKKISSLKISPSDPRKQLKVGIARLGPSAIVWDSKCPQRYLLTPVTSVLVISTT